MVVQRTLDKIEELKERPEHERRALARTWAIVAGAVLLMIWGFFAMRNIGHMAVALREQPAQQQTTSQTASVGASQQTRAAAPQQLQVASSSQGRVQLVPAQ